jgi:2-oxoglutarate dehydrogenase E2 component (dihydrolipoamide succinyltransferase)
MNDINRSAPGSVDIIAPLQQEGTKALLRTWLRKTGDQVQQDEPVAELETDKVVVEVCAPRSGQLDIVMEENSAALPGALLGRVFPVLSQCSEGMAAQTLRADTTPLHLEASSKEVRQSPSVRRLLAEHNLDITTMTGSGRGGRWTREDVIAAVNRQSPGEARSLATSFTQSHSIAQAQAPGITHQTSGDLLASTLVPHTNMRRRIAAHMHQSVSNAPHVTSIFEADLSAIMEHREKHKADFARQGVKLTFTAYFISAAAKAMAVAPEVNSRWHTDYLELFKDINIGVGVSLGEKGLIVPVVHRCQEHSLLGIAARLQNLTEAAQRGGLKSEDVQGGTFTISNHGVSGSLFAAPIIINQPQSAILGIGALEKRVVVREVERKECILVRPMAYVSLTIDHRVLDGSQTNAWLSSFVKQLEEWPRS